MANLETQVDTSPVGVVVFIVVTIPRSPSNERLGESQTACRILASHRRNP